MKRSLLYLSIGTLTAMLFWSCSGDNQSKQSSSGQPVTKQTDSTRAQSLPPQSDNYYVLDKSQKTIYGIDLKSNKVSHRFIMSEEVVAIAYDAAKELVYEAISGARPGLAVFDPKVSRVIKKFDFVQPPSDLLFHPIKRELYITSEDSTYFRIFQPDSMKTIQGYPLWVTGGKPVGPRTMSPGPAGRIYTANGARASVTTLLTDKNFAYQTIIINGARYIDNAVSSYDGNSSYCCDSKQGKVFRVEFGTGEMLAQKGDLDNPRLIQFEVNSQTVVVVTGKTGVLMLNPDNFVETGKVNLSEYGDEILSLFIPPRANYAELTMDSKGVTRWLRFDIRNWEPMRIVELY